MDRKRIALLVAGLAAFTLLTGFHGCGVNPLRDPERARQYASLRLDDELDDLQATPAQRAALHAEADKLLPEALALRAGNQAARAEALAQLQSDQPDAARLHALVDQRLDAVRALGHRLVDSLLAAHRTLTREQRQKLAERAHHRLE